MFVVIVSFFTRILPVRGKVAPLFLRNSRPHRFAPVPRRRSGAHKKTLADLVRSVRWCGILADGLFERFGAIVEAVRNIKSYFVRFFRPLLGGKASALLRLSGSEKTVFIVQSP